MSGAVVIIISQDPDDVTSPEPVTPEQAAEKADKSVTIQFRSDDSAVEVGHRVALALARLRRCG